MNIKKYIFAFSTVVAGSILLSTLSGSGRLMSNNAGAPALNCTSCHGGAINSGPGSITINIAGNPTTYIAGQVYQVSITVANASRLKFGFALSSNQGSFSTAGNTSVQLAPSYITHTASGTTSAVNSKTWAFEWTAPSTASGTAVFQAYGNATNSSNTEIGDLIYNTVKSLTPGIAGILKENALGKTEIYPNPVHDKFTLAASLNQGGTLKVDLLDLQGREVQQLYHSQAEAGLHVIPCEVNGLKPGVYFLRMEQEGKMDLKKVFVN